MKLAKEGVKLFYKLWGEGQNVFIFIHGVGGDHHILSKEANYFSKKARVLSLDLRGHGQSDKPNQSYTIEDYAQDIAFLCKHTRIKQAIVVAHSMGGNIALELSRQFPQLVSALIFLDVNLFIPEQQLIFLLKTIEALKDHFSQALDAIISARTLVTDRHTAFVKKSFSNTPQQVWVSSLESMIAWDKEKAQESVHHCSCPILYIEGPKCILGLSIFEASYPSQLVRGKIVGAGHFFPIEIPEQVNVMIDRFISVYMKKT